MKYNQNDTMKLLGHQYYVPLVEREEIFKQYKEVFDAVKNENPLMDPSECMDLFMLGYIWGKRDERARRGKKNGRETKR